jgi:hypothetical protein
MEIIDVEIIVQAQFCNEWPWVEIRSSEHIYFTGNVEEMQVIRFTIPAQNVNEITLYHKNKRFGTDGIWDVEVIDDKIVKDRAVKLLDFKLNDVSIKSWIFETCRFITDSGDCLQTDYFGHNGHINIVFNCPVYEWIICHCIKPNANPKSCDFVVNTTSENLFDYTRDIEELNEIERILNQHAYLFDKFTKV